MIHHRQMKCSKQSLLQKVKKMDNANMHRLSWIHHVLVLVKLEKVLEH